MRKTLLRFLLVALHLLVVLLLTGLTQIGGIIYLTVLAIHFFKKWSVWRTGIIFISLYLVSTFLIIPQLARMAGRVSLPLSGSLQPLSYLMPLANRHYVKAELVSTLQETAKLVHQNHGVNTHYLDANFPFWDGFPLFPHLSHNDGKKVDIAFYYNDASTGFPANDAPSFIGYGVFESPKGNEVNYPASCKEKGFWQYGLLGKLVPQWTADDYVVNPDITATYIRLLANSPTVEKIFIEPHLKERWKLAALDKIRFHGCQAVRHDDHIHIQIK